MEPVRSFQTVSGRSILRSSQVRRSPMFAEIKAVEANAAILLP
jgi:hypothetical protein